MPDKKKVMTEVLDLLNRGRACWGFAPMEELPRGMCNLPEYCVVARGLEVLAFSNRIPLAPTWAEPEEQIHEILRLRRLLQKRGGEKPDFARRNIITRTAKAGSCRSRRSCANSSTISTAGKYPESGTRGPTKDAERKG